MMMPEIIIAIITATTIVSLITALIYVSEIPELEEKYRNTQKFKEHYSSEYEQENKYEDG